MSNVSGMAVWMDGITKLPVRLVHEGERPKAAAKIGVASVPLECIGSELMRCIEKLEIKKRAATERTHGGSRAQ